MFNACIGDDGCPSPLLETRDRIQERVRQILQFRRADAMYLGECLARGRRPTRHILKRLIGEHHIGRHPARPREFRSQCLQRAQELNRLGIKIGRTQFFNFADARLEDFFVVRLRFNSTVYLTLHALLLIDE